MIVAVVSAPSSNALRLHRSSCSSSERADLSDPLGQPIWRIDYHQIDLPGADQSREFNGARAAHPRPARPAVYDRRCRLRALFDRTTTIVGSVSWAAEV